MHIHHATVFSLCNYSQNTLYLFQDYIVVTAKLLFCRKQREQGTVELTFSFEKLRELSNYKPTSNS